jgi:hypothetical protein
MLVEIEQGRVNCTIGVLHAVAHALDVSLSQLAAAACLHGPARTSTHEERAPLGAGGNQVLNGSSSDMCC